MPSSVTVQPNSSAEITLKPIPILPGQTFTVHNATDVEITMTTRGKDVQITAPHQGE